MTVKQITGIMNGYNIVEISKQGSDDCLFLGRVDEYWRYPFAVKIDVMEIDHISPDISEPNTLQIICK